MGKERDTEIKVDLLIEIQFFLLFPLSFETNPKAAQFVPLIYHPEILTLGRESFIVVN
jgi:hypothetical protein